LAEKRAPPQENERARGRSQQALTTRTLILSKALEIAGRLGLDGLTIGELAKAVGMSKSGLFAHFGGKDALQFSVLEAATERFIDVVMRPAFKEPRGEPRLKALIKNWVDHLNDEELGPAGSILISASLELDDRPGALRDYAQRVQKDLISNIEKAAKMAVDEGHFRRDIDVEQFAWSMYSFVLGYHHFNRMLEDPKADVHLKRAFRDLLDFARASASRAAATRRNANRKTKKRAIKA
jgi:AcrR family transcriptional regulator